MKNFLHKVKIFIITVGLFFFVIAGILFFLSAIAFFVMGDSASTSTGIIFEIAFIFCAIMSIYLYRHIKANKYDEVIYNKSDKSKKKINTQKPNNITQNKQADNKYIRIMEEVINRDIESHPLNQSPSKVTPTPPKEQTIKENPSYHYDTKAIEDAYKIINTTDDYNMFFRKYNFLLDRSVLIKKYDEQIAAKYNSYIIKSFPRSLEACTERVINNAMKLTTPRGTMNRLKSESEYLRDEGIKHDSFEYPILDSINHMYVIIFNITNMYD